jgi:hypothetical protein
MNLFEVDEFELYARRFKDHKQTSIATLQMQWIGVWHLGAQKEIDSQDTFIGVAWKYLESLPEGENVFYQNRQARGVTSIRFTVHALVSWH